MLYLFNQFRLVLDIKIYKEINMDNKQANNWQEANQANQAGYGQGGREGQQHHPKEKQSPQHQGQQKQEKCQPWDKE